MPRGVFCSGAGAWRWGGGGWLGGAAGRCAEPLRERLLIFISQISRRGKPLLYKSKSGQGVANLPCYATMTPSGE